MRLIDGMCQVVVALDGKTHHLGRDDRLQEAADAAQSASGASFLV